MTSAATRIIVLGTHRSGTSVLAEVVHAWGAYAGEKTDLMEADRINPRGYWEYWPLVRLDDALLEEAGGRWSCPPEERSRISDLASVPAWRGQARSLLGKMDCESDRWLWKDPRLATLLPFWREIWDEPVYVIPVRDPIESAMSLRKRDRFPISAGLLLWQLNLTTVLETTRESGRRIFVDYQALTDDPACEIPRLASFLDECAGAGETSSETLRSMIEAVSPNLHRQRARRPFSEEPLATPAQRALHEILQRAPEDPELPFDPADYPIYPGWREYLETVTELQDLKTGRAAATLEEKRIREERDLAHRERILAEREQEIAALLDLRPPSL
jgi:hypothetical protein